MTDTKEIFLDKDLRLGGFYELCIQDCPSIDNEPIKKYTDYIWSLKNVDGPYDNDFHKTSADINNFRHEGILHLDNFNIPIVTINIRETEPIETGFNWFDICFYTAAIEKVFGEDFKTWTENPKCPKQIDDFFTTILKDLFEISKFKLAIIDFEVSGQYYLDDLSADLSDNWTNSIFYIGRDNYNIISPKNKDLVTIID